MCELDQNTIMVELGFVNEVVVVSGDDYKDKCKLIKVLLEDNTNVEKIEIKVNFDSEYFKRFIVNNELECEELNVPFSVNLEKGIFGEFISYRNECFKSMFIQLGYFGADDTINLLRNIVKKVIRYRYVNHKSVENFLSENKKDLYHIYSNPNISDSFVRSEFEYILNAGYWPTVCGNPSISLELLIEHEEHMNWTSVSKRELPIWFVVKYAEQLDWFAVCAFAALNDKFVDDIPIEFFQQRKKWKCLAMNHHLSEEFIEKNIGKGNIVINSHIDYLVQNKGLSEKFFLKYFKSLVYCALQSSLSCHPNLTATFYNKVIKEYPYMLSWQSLCSHPNLPQSFFEEHKCVNVNELAKNPNISFDFIKSIVSQKILNTQEFKYHLYQNAQMDEKIIKRAISERKDNTICWNALVLNTSMSEIFLKKIKRRIQVTEFQKVIYNSFRYNHKVDYKNHYLGKFL
jgi:hypothetical protein